jgi:hypothetical protein
MNTRLIMDERDQLKEISQVETTHSQPVRILAMIISYLFHPVFIPIYIVVFMLYIHPGIFAGFSAWKKKIVLLQAGVPYFLLPVVTVLLLRGLNFIDSVFLKTRKDRIIPFIACNVWYFYIWYVWRNLPDTPPEMAILGLSVFIASSMGILANIYIKISMHALAVGVMMAFMLVLAITQGGSFGAYISVAILITGLVCTSRFIVSDHSALEIYAGLFGGALAVLASVLFS